MTGLFIFPFYSIILEKLTFFPPKVVLRGRGDAQGVTLDMFLDNGKPLRLLSLPLLVILDILKHSSPHESEINLIALTIM